MTFKSGTRTHTRTLKPLAGASVRESTRKHNGYNLYSLIGRVHRGVARRHRRRRAFAT